LQVYSGLQLFLQEELFSDFEKAKNMPEDGMQIVYQKLVFTKE